MSEAGFLLISDPAIRAVPVMECHEPLVDIREFDIRVSSARASFYHGFAFVRLTVAAKLAEAARLLPPGYSFLFSEGHRPISLQRQMFEEYCTELQRQQANWDRATIEREATKFIASPDDVPPHSTGGAIDLTILDAQGLELDMGSILDDIPDQVDNLHFTSAASISAEGKINRQLLIDVLTQVGFVNYPAEWWHWSYGDKYWAYHTQQVHAIYDSTELTSV